jgi:hypothetical protein
MSLFGKVLAQVKIEAGPAFPSGLATVFPVPAVCTVGGQPEPCLRWEYRWSVQTSGVSLENGLLSVDSDVTIHASDPAGATVTKSLPSIFPVDTDGERFLKFGTGNVTTFTGSYFTPASILPGTLTAAFTGKKGAIPTFARCALAGADNIGVQQNQAVADEKSYRIPGAVVAFKLAPPPDGRVIPGSVMVTPDAGGSVENFPIEETNEPINFDNLGATVFNTPLQVTTLGSCKYSWTNTTGGRSTVSCSTCCVNKATNQCVLSSSLTNPATQCKTGTFP